MADVLRPVVELLIQQLDATRAYLLPGHREADERAQAAIDTARAALAAEPPAPAPAADGAARLRQCPTHGQQPANAWACPECLRELREELARLKAPAADGEREELAALIEQTADSHNGLWPGPIIGKLFRAAALLREPAPAAARPAPTPDDFRRWWRETGSDDSGPTPEMLLTANAWAEAWAAMRQPAPAPVPVPVADRPWERPDWCDVEGRCWWGRCADEVFNPEWALAPHADIKEFCSDAMPQHCLPHWAIPQPPQGGEVEA